MQGELLVQDEGKEEAGTDEEIVAESVELPVVGSPDEWVKAHAIDDRQGAHNEHYLHHRVVQRYELREQI